MARKENFEGKCGGYRGSIGEPIMGMKGEDQFIL